MGGHFEASNGGARGRIRALRSPDSRARMAAAVRAEADPAPQGATALKYFVLELTYLAPLDKVAEGVVEHRAHLDLGYQRGWLLASGPQNPKVGGVVIARAPERADLEAFIAQDPFVINKIASYRFIEFEPVKRHPEMAGFFTA